MYVVEVKLLGAKADSHMKFSFNVKDDSASNIGCQLEAAVCDKQMFLGFCDADDKTHYFRMSEIREVHIKGD